MVENLDIGSLCENLGIDTKEFVKLYYEHVEKDRRLAPIVNSNSTTVNSNSKSDSRKIPKINGLDALVVRCLYVLVSHNLNQNIAVRKQENILKSSKKFIIEFETENISIDFSNNLIVMDFNSESEELIEEIEIAVKEFANYCSASILLKINNINSFQN